MVGTSILGSWNGHWQNSSKFPIDRRMKWKHARLLVLFFWGMIIGLKPLADFQLWRRSLFDQHIGVQDLVWREHLQEPYKFIPVRAFVLLSAKMALPQGHVFRCFGWFNNSHNQGISREWSGHSDVWFHLKMVPCWKHETSQLGPPKRERRRTRSGSQWLFCWTQTGWWFGTFFIFHNIWDSPSHWLIFFKILKTTNQQKSDKLNCWT